MPSGEATEPDSASRSQSRLQPQPQPQSHAQPQPQPQPHAQPQPPAQPHVELPLRTVVHTWWPLAASWLLMGLELPLVSAILARLPDPKISLAAYGGVVFPLSMIVEAPIIMLLSASTALSKDEASYRLIHRFMMRMGAALTVLHLAIVATPLFDVIIVGLLHAPEEIRHPARIGLWIMLPWTWSIAYRRMQQGVLIRFGRSRYVGAGTIVRLGSNALVLAAGYAIHTLPGIVVGASAVATGVVAEAVFSGIAVRPVLRHRLPAEPPQAVPLTFGTFLHFYVPLAMTPLIVMLNGPIGSAAIGRMPRTLDSLAVWPVINGLGFLFRSVGVAFNEVVVALLDFPGAARALRRFAFLLATATSLLLLLILATPAAAFYFRTVTSLSETLSDLARSSAWLILIGPALGVLQSWHQGTLVHARLTRAVTESVVVFLLTSATVLAIGIAHGRLPGIYVALAGTMSGNAAQVAWLAWRSRPIRHALGHGAETASRPRAAQAGTGGVGGN